VDIVLGVSMAPTSVRMLLVEGENADGVTVEDNQFDITTDDEAATLSAADQVISAQALPAYRPALEVITAIAVFGLAIALSGLVARPVRRRRAEPEAAGDQAEEQAVACCR